MRKSFSSFLVPLAGVDVVEQGARGVARIGDMTLWPLVSFQISQVSTVPKSRSPASARARTPGTLSRIHAILVPEK
jgi:hypothetical protein